MTDHATTTAASDSADALDGERADLLAALRKHRAFLVQTLDGVSDADAGRRTTVSELCLGGLVKHVAQTETTWAAFVVEGASAFPRWDDPDAFQARVDGFTMLPDDTVASVLEAYAEVAARTDELVASVPSLDVAHALPEAPWFTDGSWSARRAFLHVIAETSQHAGHADIIREALDGAKTMG